MRLSDLLRDYSDGDGHGWDVEFAYLRRDHASRIDDLARDVLLNGIREPVLLGDDGRVWDGHHRLCVADELGIVDIPTITSKESAA